MTTPALTQLCTRLNDITDELVGLHVELGECLKVEHTNRTTTWIEAEGSDQTRTRLAAFHTLDLTSDIFTIKAQIAGLEADRLRVLTLIDVEHTNLKLQSHLDS
jgi:hypothetical protein